MLREERHELFRQIITNKYSVYNSLFLNLPHKHSTYTGIYIPLLRKLSQEGFEAAKSPAEIVKEFIQNHTDIKTQDDEFVLLFRIIQYIERQVVLFDCVEDAAFLDFQRPQIGSYLQPENDYYESLKEHLKSFSTRLVFTAHPTQFYPNEVQIIMYELRQAIQKNDITKIDVLLNQLAYTPFVKREKPTPFDEAKSIIYYMRYVYYQTIGKLYHEIFKNVEEDPDFNPNLIELGFWPGGDRDGNPFVKYDTTRKVSQLLRNTIMKCYYNHIKDLRKKLTFKGVVEITENLKQRLYKQIFQDEVCITDQEILEGLYKIKNTLKKEYKSLFLDEVNDIIGRVHLFGSHFATLDVRQDSSKHLEAMQIIFRQAFNKDYDKLSRQEKISYLTEKSLELNADDFEDETLVDTIRNVYQIKDIQEENGERALHRYIISNTESIFDVLHVYALFKYCGYQDEDIKIDIVPLFETMVGMDNSQDVMKDLYELPVYKKHLEKRDNIQTIMLGFSDGTKDGGYLKANWEILQTKERLTKVTKDHSNKVVFFDGRGGPPARGGGKTHQFYASQGDDVSNEKIQLTIQGQTITSIYGTHEQASYNLEQLLLAGAKPFNKSVKLSQHYKDLISELAMKSYKKYTALKDDKLFVPYLENMTTLKYYGATNIGSRPTKRNGKSSLNFSDLRAIPFVGSWSTIRQNVPGYYGLGTALESYADEPEVIEDLYKNSAFFRTLINNSMMSMKKSYFPLTQYMKDDKVYGEFWKELRAEYELSKKWALKLTGIKELMDNEKTTRLSISARENIILPLLCIQQYALQMIQQDHPEKDKYEKLVMRCLFGNINASRNSA
ncbi:phosphoenolpyruvate carboxylase [Mesohalobacter halotolerans]|uniref:Phosphoenolpyruvate carboxylase n=1 Tax=Mesohalobacter halotolerans TaxID=1883405 RepID=A0A4U5TR57_9FLAO|nr:phosphoenolpyruvate carboxylase [Mesohalobacter halotolerans]TKS56720.1 phosphoenolpyruvate carboxylase [Mesohalobacter halotolerans]